MQLCDANTCRQIRCGHLYIVDGVPGCDCGRMHDGLFSCREFDAVTERAEVYQ